MNVEVGGGVIAEDVCGVDAKVVGGAISETGGVISETGGDINANVVCKGDADFGCAGNAEVFCAVVANSFGGANVEVGVEVVCCVMEDVKVLSCECAASVSAAASITNRSPTRSAAASRAMPAASVKMTRASASTSTARMWSFGKSGSRHVNAAPARDTPSCDAYKLAVSRGRSTATMDSFSCE